MISQGQIIVNGLRTADETCRMTCYDRVVRKFLDRVHRVISADVDESLDVQFIQDTEYFFVNFFVLMDLRQFVAAGAEEGCRCSF